MRFFFKSRQFKVILAVFLSLVILSVTSLIIGNRISPQSDLLGSVLAPFRTAFVRTTQGFDNLFSAFLEGEEALLKNAELEAEIAILREDTAKLEELEKENAFYKEFLEIKETHPDFTFQKATQISKETKDPYKGFTINAGSTQDIELHDPVITKAGLVGYVSQVGLTTSKVTTILDPDITLGALDNRTSDSGILYGNTTLAKKNLTGLYNLSRSCNVAVGDFIVTSGEGIFPEGLLIGTVRSIGSEKYNTSLFAEVEPFADLSDIRDVMVITGFEGQGGLDPNK